MGLFDFVKDAGEKLFGGGTSKAEVVRTPDLARAERDKGAALKTLVAGMDLGVDPFDVHFAEGRATLSGRAPSQEVREKVVLLVGNTQGVAQVDDQLEVAEKKPEAVMYTVQPGDSLSKIAKAHYGDAMKYTMIFEANRPMLKDPNKIYPGQTLRIPPQE